MECRNSKLICIMIIALCNWACEQPQGKSERRVAPTSAAINDSDQSVLIFSSTLPVVQRELRDRIASFKVKEDAALKLAEEEFDRRQALGIKDDGGIMGKKPLVIVGREYLFGKPYKARKMLRGYWVNGDTGKVEWRDQGELKSD